MKLFTENTTLFVTSITSYFIAFNAPLNPI